MCFIKTMCFFHSWDKPPKPQKSIWKDNVKCHTLFSSWRELSCFCPCLFWTQGRDLDPAALDICTGLYHFAGLPHYSPNVELIECWTPHNTELGSKVVHPLKLGLVGFRKPYSKPERRRWGDCLYDRLSSQVSTFCIPVFSFGGYWGIGQLTN